MYCSESGSGSISKGAAARAENLVTQSLKSNLMKKMCKFLPWGCPACPDRPQCEQHPPHACWSKHKVLNSQRNIRGGPALFSCHAIAFSVLKKEHFCPTLKRYFEPINCYRVFRSDTTPPSSNHGGLNASDLPLSPALFCVAFSPFSKNFVESSAIEFARFHFDCSLLLLKHESKKKSEFQCTNMW